MSFEHRIKNDLFSSSDDCARQNLEFGAFRVLFTCGCEKTFYLKPDQGDRASDLLRLKCEHHRTKVGRMVYWCAEEYGDEPRQSDIVDVYDVALGGILTTDVFFQDELDVRISVKLKRTRKSECQRDVVAKRLEQRRGD